jgi:hypothetical protein
MKVRKTATILVLGLAVVTLASLVAAQVEKRSRQSTTKICPAPNSLVSPAALRDQKNPAAEEPTVIQEGMMTEKQKKHAKLFKRYGTLTRGKKLTDSTSSADVNVAIDIPDNPRPRVFDLNTYLHGLACKADAIVVGVVKSKSSQLTEDKSFTFSEYDIEIQELLKNNSASPLEANGHITLARPGGAVMLQGRILRAVDRSERPLQNGRFLLFLQYIPETGAYKSYVTDIGDASFELRADKLAQVSDDVLPFGEGRNVDAASFLTQLRSALSGSCTN